MADYFMEKAMATHSSVLAWRIPGTAEPGGLLSMGLHRAGHDWSDSAAAADYIMNGYLPMVPPTKKRQYITNNSQDITFLKHVLITVKEIITWDSVVW